MFCSRITGCRNIAEKIQIAELNDIMTATSLFLKEGVCSEASDIAEMASGRNRFLELHVAWQLSNSSYDRHLLQATIFESKRDISRVQL